MISITDIYNHLTIRILAYQLKFPEESKEIIRMAKQLDKIIQWIKENEKN